MSAFTPSQPPPNSPKEILSSLNFPCGFGGGVRRTEGAGRKAGLWLTPLIAVKSSRLFREHADWFVRDEHGRHISAGFNWGEQLYALDTTHPAVLEWLAALMRQVRAWGYDYLKLDFLYAGALPGKRHCDMPREAAYRNGLKVMREAMGKDTFFLACGAPIIPSLGLCDALRIGPDVSGKWESYRDAVLLQNPTTPGAKNAIRTTLNRLWLSPLVHVDPDVVYFNSKNNSLAPGQKQLLQDLALICNFKATSDLPGWLSTDEKNALRGFLEANPTITQSGQYTFQIDGRDVDFSPAMLPPPSFGHLREAHSQSAFQIRKKAFTYYFDYFCGFGGGRVGVIARALVSWLGNQGWVLKILNEMKKLALEEKFI